jgi:hypothetical protein
VIWPGADLMKLERGKRTTRNNKTQPGWATMDGRKGALWWKAEESSLPLKL